MATIDPVLVKYLAYLGFAFILWLLPAGANLAPLFSIVCLVGAVAAFWFASREGRQLGTVLKKSRMKQRAADELDYHALASRTMFAMEAITRDAELEFSMPVNQPVPVAALPPATIDDETQEYINLLSSLSSDIGWVSASELKRRRKQFRSFEIEEIREFFAQLANMGIGKIQGSGASIEWSNR